MSQTASPPRDGTVMEGDSPLMLWANPFVQPPPPLSGQTALWADGTLGRGHFGQRALRISGRRHLALGISGTGLHFGHRASFRADASAAEGLLSSTSWRWANLKEEEEMAGGLIAVSHECESESESESESSSSAIYCSVQYRLFPRGETSVG